MRPTRVRLPELEASTLAATCVVLVGICLAVGMGMRNSLTSYGKSPEEVDGMPYVAYASDENALNVASEQSIEAAAKRLLGDDTDAWSTEDLWAMTGLYSEDVSGGSEVVLTATYTGRSSYAYQTFVRELEVTSVVEGPDAKVGDTILVYEPLYVRNGADGPEVSPSANSPYMLGLTPMRDGEEYLLFLNAKRYPEEMDASRHSRTYCLVFHPYCRVPTDVDDISVLVAGEGTSVSFADAQAFDMIVTDEAARGTYLDVCKRIIGKTLG